MKKLKVYIDTSVIGGCFDEEFSKWSNLLFTEFKQGKLIAVVSDITLDELNNAPENVRRIIENIPESNLVKLSIDNESEQLAQIYIKENAITKKYADDARHIAIATVNNLDVLVSWNFKHIVNINRIHQYNAVNIRHKYKAIEIRTPREVVDEN